MASVMEAAGGAGPAGKLEPFDPNEYELRKRLPPRDFSLRENDIYVTQRTHYAAQLKRAQKLLDAKGFSEVYIHGLGNAINRAINVALQLKESGLGSLELSVNTKTVRLTDELQPLVDDLMPTSRVRNVSAVEIKVFRLT